MSVKLRWLIVFAHLNFILSFVQSSTPNIVFILTDDQDLLLNGLMSMKKTSKLLTNQGRFFQNFYVNSPICCPSRSTILTGKYAHNLKVVNNSVSGNCASLQWQRNHEPYTIAALLQSSKNYTTFYAGKYLNQYGSKVSGGTKHVPKGYNWWLGLKGNSVYYNYTLSLNGTAKFFPNQYLTDVLSNYATQFLNQQENCLKPFFMMIAPPAPHSPFTAAQRHLKRFPDVKALRTPSFNYSSVDKHWIVGRPPKYLPSNVTILDNIQRHRMQALLAVDDMIETIIKKLTKMSVLNNTYIILSSDNGFHIGQFTQPWDKRQPYETDVRVPFIIKGPNIPRKTISLHPASAVDIAPTILDLAGVNIPSNFDGRSFKKQLFSNNIPNKKKIFIEYWGEGLTNSNDPNCNLNYDSNLYGCIRDNWCKCEDSRNNTYSCFIEFNNKRNGNSKFCKFLDNKNFIEYYDLMKDPNELKNIGCQMSDDLMKIKLKDLEQFENCAGKTCLDI